MIYNDGGVFSGSFLNDLPHGEGELEYANKDVFKG